ncbi:MAG: crossover junction endodeoxyribonuclease RuvC [Clostridia bacterium]|nr:crossover junction endodeoxyribonuclease RuvC [Clostridia bacterium]
MRVLGIDPGFALVGFGIVDQINGQFEVVDYGVISTHKDESFSTRLAIIYKGMCDLIDTYKPDAIAIEELFFFKNQKTVIPVAEARGVIVLSAIQKNGNVFEYTPLQIKQALTGNGRAEKKQIQYMVKSILGLESVPKPDDAADAVAVAITHLQTNSLLGDNRV